MTQAEPPSDPTEPHTPSFDIEAARARYRRMMRGRFMRGASIFTAIVILVSWMYTAVAFWAPDVEHLPGHDISVGRNACLSCHAPTTMDAPPMNHPPAPSCGFCHLQSVVPQQ